MATNIEIDDKLVKEAMKLGGQSTKRALIHDALVEFVARRKQQRILDLFGKVEYDEDYDYKAGRQRGPKS